MKLKGLVWFFAITLVVISLYQLSFTWVVNSFEKQLKQKAQRYVAINYPNVTGDDKDAMVKAELLHIMDSNRDTKIYPIFGTTYLKCKENELNLGLDLQGGMNVTLNVDLEGVIKSLSNNPHDPQLINALNETTAEKVKSDLDYITLFGQVFKKQNPGVNLASLFAGPGKTIKVTDSDQQVLDQLQTVSKTAIEQTYKILNKRIDQFGVAQPNINLDENKDIISVELAGAQDPVRVRKLLQASAHLQFWEVYNIGDLQNSFVSANKALAQLLSGTKDTTKNQSDSTSKIDSTQQQLANQQPLTNLIQFGQPQTGRDGKQMYPSAIGNVLEKDTSKLNQYLNLDVVKNNFPANAKFLYGIEQKGRNDIRFFELYAIKTIPGSDKAKLEGDGVEDASQDYDDHGQAIIRMRMTPIGTGKWGKLTTDNVGKPIAIVLDDVVYSAPNVDEPITNGSSEIRGGFSTQEAQDLANILKIGKIDAPAKIVQEETVGPTLGAQAVHGGAIAFLLSFIVIFILMLLYYNTAGWIANIALILNLLFTIGILSALGATLTAAGIAGLVLTIGMAVDTNVIIFERIKEELTRGKSYQQSVSDGYRRSYAPVIDAHVTVFLTAAILFYFGLGPVLGFATTQMLGITLSLFCGILISRLVTDVYTNRQRHFKYFTAFSRRIFKHANFKFIEYRKVAYFISIFVLIFGIGSFFNGFKYGVEFRGGRSYTVAFDKNVKNEDIRNPLRDAFAGEYPEIKTVGDNKHLNITTSFMEGVANADSAVQAHLFNGLKSQLPAGTTLDQFVKKNIQGWQVVQPVISKDLRNGAIKATIFALIAIIAYIFLRFRDLRYSIGTIVSLLHDVFVALAVFSFFKNIVPFPLEIDQHFIAAILTVIGFSMNDTVIVFDRIREYSREMKGADKPTIINRAVNDTLSRTIMTSATVFLTLLILFIFGGEVTRGFSFAMLIGVITGTYSSIFVAAPILVDFAKDRPLGEADHATEKAKKVEAARLARTAK